MLVADYGRAVGRAGMVALALGLAPVGRANATLIVSYNVAGGNGAGTAGSCEDNAACDTNATTGQLQLQTFTDAGVTITGAMGSSTKASPTDGLSVSATTIKNNSNAAATVTLTISDTSFAAPVNGLTVMDGGTATPLGAFFSATFTFFADTANGQGATAYNITPGAQVRMNSDTLVNATTTNGFSFDDPTVRFSANDPFSLTEQLTVVLGPGASASLSESETGTVMIPTNPMPEPVSLSVVCAGLLGLGLTRRVLGAGREGRA